MFESILTKVKHLIINSYPLKILSNNAGTPVNILLTNEVIRHQYPLSERKMKKFRENCGETEKSKITS